MPGFVLHVGASAICPHGGQIATLSTNTRVLVGGQPVATLNDAYPVVGCPFTVPGKPQPCVSVQWLVPAARVRVNNLPVILQTSAGLCRSAEQIPQGVPIVVAAQPRVVGA
jgi:hypothetical protein